MCNRHYHYRTATAITMPCKCLPISQAHTPPTIRYTQRVDRIGTRMDFCKMSGADVNGADMGI